VTNMTSACGNGGHLLYLDFDGVLHPSEVFWSPLRGVHLDSRMHGHALFENLPLLMEALANFPQVRVVLSTSWVPSRGLDGTLEQLPIELRQRIIGATFDAEQMIHERWASVARGYQVLDDVRRRRPARWVALDDDVADWPEEHVDKLIATDGVLGLRRPNAVKELIRCFRSWGLDGVPSEKS
jgi:hypothetical protein